MRHFVLICILFISSLVNAQTHYEGRISFGGKGGITLSRINFNPSVQQTMALGMTGGVMFRYIEEKNFGLIAELNMAQRGWKEAFDDAEYNYSHSFTYFELPIMTHIFFGNNRIKGFFNLGPELNVMIGDHVSSNFDYLNTAEMEYFIQSTRHNEQYSLPINNRFDYGICVGAGAEVNLNTKHSILVEGRFYYGLTDVFANHKIDVFAGSNSLSIGVTLGYFYRLK